MLSGAGDTLVPSLQPPPWNRGSEGGKGGKDLLGSGPPWLPCTFLGAELALEYIYSSACIICLSFKRHRMFLREFRALKTHIYKQADMALRHN